MDKVHQIYNMADGSVMTAFGHDDTSVAWKVCLWTALFTSGALFVTIQVHLYRNLNLWAIKQQAYFVLFF